MNINIEFLHSNFEYRVYAVFRAMLAVQSAVLLLQVVCPSVKLTCPWSYRFGTVGLVWQLPHEQT